MEYVNNHIHTTYSFSPYTPAQAVQAAKRNGLTTAGIMDHDSSGGAKEFIAAGEHIGMPVTCGIECRVHMSNTRLNGRRINNPDQNSVAYVAMHGIPHQNIDNVNDWLAPYRAHRNERNDKMCLRITELVRPFGLELDFERDVMPISNFAVGGSVTERHILFALAKKITARFPNPADVVEYLRGEMGLPISAKQEKMLLEADPKFYEYDILGLLKGNMVEKFYIPATDECPDVRDFIDMVRTYGGISAYAYLGDVGESVTGDKKAQKFEDDYINELFEVIREVGFDAVTYMPTRNSAAQLDLIMRLCEKNGFFQISGEDINSPRQSFVCPAYENPKFDHLVTAAHTLIEYENDATRDLSAARSKYDYIFSK
ncbi:MAG: PHP domain-containing protein [Eubacteriales bacterium]